MIGTNHHNLCKKTKRKKGRHEGKQKEKSERNNLKMNGNTSHSEDERQSTDQCGGDELRVGGESGSTWSRSMIAVPMWGRSWSLVTMIDSVVGFGSHDQHGQDNADEGEADQITSCSCHLNILLLLLLLLIWFSLFVVFCRIYQQM